MSKFKSKLETEKSINMVEMSTLAVSDKLWAQRLQIIIKFGKEFGKRAKQDQFVIIHTILNTKNMERGRG